jgi:hypothetical protein
VRALARVAVAPQVENYKSIREFGAVASRAAQGSKPCIVFAGDGFETDAVRNAHACTQPH